MLMAVATLSPTTQATYEAARRSFEKIAGKPIGTATRADCEAWLYALRATGVSVQTCRTYLTGFNWWTGLGVSASGLPSPKRQARVVLSIEQLKAMLRLMSDDDREMFIELLSGLNDQPFTPRDLTRRLQRYALKAGVNASQVSLRVWQRTGAGLSQAEIGSLRKTERIPPPTVAWATLSFGTQASAADGTGRDPRLHGIGRRSR
jgi:hypothetical protein